MHVLGLLVDDAILWLIAVMLDGDEAVLEIPVLPTLVVELVVGTEDLLVDVDIETVLVVVTGVADLLVVDDEDNADELDLLTDEEPTVEPDDLLVAIVVCDELVLTDEDVTGWELVLTDTDVCEELVTEVTLPLLNPVDLLRGHFLVLVDETVADMAVPGALLLITPVPEPTVVMLATLLLVVLVPDPEETTEPDALLVEAEDIDDPDEDFIDAAETLDETLDETAVPEETLLDTTDEVGFD